MPCEEKSKTKECEHLVSFRIDMMMKIGFMPRKDAGGTIKKGKHFLFLTPKLARSKRQGQPSDQQQKQDRDET